MPNCTSPTIKIDLHIHTCASKDGALHPAGVIEAAKRKGLDRICITDHNTIEGALVAQKIDPEFVIVGEEILTALDVEILAFFVRRWVPPRLSIQETIERLKAQGAIISISHPFDRYRNKSWTEAQLEAVVPRIDAIESFNARMRDELLDGEIFYTLVEARIIIEQWRQHYIKVRPHSALNYRPPAPETIVPIDRKPTMH